ncbi:MAG TPA: DUF3996 domain-containing protein [Polyangia bacterium]|nr:DUF3996 domain-containing protein [Polyangia bacterium]
MALSENETLTDSVVAAGRVPFRPCARPKKRTNRSTRTRIEHSPTKRLILFTCAAAAILSAGASLAQATEVGNSRNFGLGFQLGEPTAITAKAFLGRAHAMDFGLGFGGLGYGYCRDNNGNGYRCNDLNHDLSLHADYLYQDNIVNMTNRLDWYAGFGGRVIMWAYGSNNLAHDVVVIARIPIGIAASFWRPDFLEAYLEIVPGIAVFPLGFNIDFGLGVRAFF